MYLNQLSLILDPIPPSSMGGIAHIVEREKLNHWISSCTEIFNKKYEILWVYVESYIYTEKKKTRFL